MTRPTSKELSATKRKLMAAWLEGKAPEAAASVGIPRRLDDGPAPLSFSQRRLWFLDQMVPGNPFYNIPCAIQLPASTDTRVLERCLNEIVRRHESLRTTFAIIDGEPVQLVAPQMNIPLPTTSLQQLPYRERQAEASRLATQEASTPFDLQQGPLIRTALVDLGPQGKLFMLTLHHIVGDAWSVGLLFSELQSLFEAFAAGRPSPLAELPIQYADFAVWQRDRLRGAVIDQQLAYWEEQLRGLPTIELPTQRPRPPMPSFRGANHDLRLSRSLSASLRHLGNQVDATPFMTLLAAFKCLLHRYSGQTDIVVGSPVANRQQPELEGLIGFFVNSLVLRSPVEASDSFLTVLERVRDMALAAQAHQDVPFEMLVERLQPERDLSRNPLFQVTLQIANTPTTGAARGSDSKPEWSAEHGSAVFDLALNLWETTRGIQGQIEYSTDLFDADAIERLATHYKRILEAAVADPTRAIGALPLSSAPEDRRILRDWNATGVDFGPLPCVHELVEVQAKRSPDALAVVSDEEEVTYHELDGRANQLAHHLMTSGVQPRARVAVWCGRSVDLVLALLGVLKTGGTYVPIDPGHPPARARQVIEDSGCVALITETSLLHSLADEIEDRIAVVCPARDRDVIAQQSTAVPRCRGDLDAGAYVIYTSGSSGLPKGVLISHAALANHMLWMQERFPLDATDCVLQRTATGFDASVWEFYAPLIAGGCLALAPRNANLDLELLLESICQHHATIVQLVPSILRLLLEQHELGQCISLRRLFCGGEVLDADVARRALDALGDVELVNLYGPTEATIDATYHVVEPDLTGKEIPIGRPIANARAYVLDRESRPVPVGVPGELHLAGAGLAIGYLNQPELTSERFIDDPFSPQPGARLYKTGDRARYRPDGALEFLGRADDQVKLRGYRIELGEIETALHQIPGIAAAAVAMRYDLGSEARLVAYVVGNDEASPSAAPTPSATTLRRQLQADLPGYMVPSHFVWLDSLPALSNGKLDRNSLPAPDAVRPELEDAYVAPRSEAEKTLAAIWIELLGLDRVGAHDNFFELGGDSILSIQIIVRAKQAGLQLAPQDIFQHQTISELAERVVADTLIEAEQGLVTGSVPLTPIQRWFFEQDRVDWHHFNQAVALTLPGRLRLEIVRTILGSLLEHHDALRHRFDHSGGEWQQASGEPPLELPLEFVDLEGLDEAASEKIIEEVTASLHANLKPERGELFRAALFSDATSSRLLLVAHHLVVDTVSWTILLEDFERAYQQLSRGAAIALPAKTTSFKSWAERLLQLAVSPDIQQELPRWQSSLRSVALLPTDFGENKDNTVGSARTITTVLDEETTDALLRRIPATYRTRVLDSLLAALARTLADWAGGTAVLVDFERHGREPIFTDVDVSRTVGWFTSLHPVMLNLAGCESPGDALLAAKETLRDVPGQGLGYGLLRYLHPDPGVRERIQALPRAEISFNYLGRFRGERGTVGSEEPADEQSTGSWYSPRGIRSYLLEINAVVAGDKLQTTWTYSEGSHERSTIERVAERFQEALRDIVEHCESAGPAAYTPSDFSSAGLTQGELDSLMSQLDGGEKGEDE